MTDREKYDALAAELKANWADVTADTAMTGDEWDIATAAAKAGEDQLRATFP